MSRTLAFFSSGYLFESDGTAAGTMLVQDVGYPSNITAIGDGGVVFTTELDSDLEAGLFVTDGTANGTVLLNGSFSPFQEAAHFSTANATSLTDFTPLGDGKVLFAGGGGTPSGGTQLWITDGTFAGTTPLVDFGNTYDVNVTYVTPLGNGAAVFDVGGAGATLPGLWATDGTSAGTIRLTAAALTPEAVLDGAAITVAADGNGGTLLGVTDGTLAGTTTIYDFPAGGGVGNSGGVSDFTAIGSSKVLFDASDGQAGEELWVTDGTAAGTVKLAQEAVSAADPTGLDPYDLTRLSGGEVAFLASDGGTGTELWVSDGTAAGTTPITDIDPGASTSVVGGFTPFGAGKALFHVENYTTDTDTLWVTDGTSAGTTPLQTLQGVDGLPPAVSAAALPDGDVLYDVLDGVADTDIWVSDGTAAGTILIAALPQDQTFSAADFSVLPDGRALFSLTGARNEETLWSTDGTAAGTGPLGDLSIDGTVAIATVASSAPAVGGSLSAEAEAALGATLAALAPAGTALNVVEVTGNTASTPVAGDLNAFVVSGAYHNTNLALPAGFPVGYLLDADTGLTDANGGSLLVAIGADDTLQGAAADTLIGGNGNGTLIAGGGAETFFGGSVANFFDLAASFAVANTFGTDTIVGSTASDTVNAAGAPLFFGGSGTTLFNALGSTATLVGGGAETVSAGGANVLLFSGAGGVDFVAGSGASTVVGGAGGNTLTGGAGGTLFFGRLDRRADRHRRRQRHAVFYRHVGRQRCGLGRGRFHHHRVWRQR
jgi:ELWxxDGT repeat protein